MALRLPAIHSAPYFQLLIIDILYFIDTERDKGRVVRKEITLHQILKDYTFEDLGKPLDHDVWKQHLGSLTNLS